MSEAQAVPAGFTLRTVLRGAKAPIGKMAWSPDGTRIVAPTLGDGVYVWNVAVGLPGRLDWPNYARDAFVARWSPTGRTLVVGSRHGVHLFDHGSPRRAWFAVILGGASTLEWSSELPLVRVGSHSGDVWHVDIRERRLSACASRPLAGGGVFSIASSPSVTMFAGFGGAVVEDSTVMGRPRVVAGMPDLLFSAIWLPQQERFVCSGRSGIYVADLEGSTIVAQVEGHSSDVHSLSNSADGSMLASKSADDTVRLWRTRDWQCVAILAEAKNNARRTPSLAFHPTNPTVLATLGDNDHSIRIWDLDLDLLLGQSTQAASPAAVHYTTARIALVGDSGVGKTGLGYRLAHSEFKEHPSTHGQQFWLLDALCSTTEGVRREAVLWDFAGQPDYRLIHALFLDQVDIALLLFDPTKRDETLAGVEYWLRHLDHGREGNPCPRILVGARLDRGSPTMTHADLEAWCESNGIDSYIGTSAFEGEGLDDLLARIDDILDWSKLTRTVTTVTFKRVKDGTLALKAADEHLLLTPAALRQHLEAGEPDWDFTDAEMLTAVRNLASHGYVSLLHGGSHILLAPEVLANLASSMVLEARRHPKGLGALDERALLRGDIPLRELEGLDPATGKLLTEAAIALFLQHHICFRESLGTQTLLIFPGLINERRPAGEETQTADAVTYRVTGRVENLYASLVVRLGYTPNFVGKHHWRDQAYYRARYRIADEGLCGFRQVADREGEIELVIEYSTGFGSRRFFEGLVETFLRGRDVSVTRFPRADCPECGYAIERATYVRRISEGKGFLFCPECGHRQPLPKQGEVIALAPEERAQVYEAQRQAALRTTYEQALVALKALLPDDAARPTAFVSYAWGDEQHEAWVADELHRDLRNADVEAIIDVEHGARLGQNVARFVERADETGWVIVVGTPAYLAKHQDPARTKVVAAEMDLIHQRLVGSGARPDTVIPLLAEGDPQTALPPLLRGQAYGDMTEPARYFQALFDLVLTLHGVDQAEPEIQRWKRKLRPRSGPEMLG